MVTSGELELSVAATLLALALPSLRTEMFSRTVSPRSGMPLPLPTTEPPVTSFTVMAAVWRRGVLAGFVPWKLVAMGLKSRASTDTK